MSDIIKSWGRVFLVLFLPVGLDNWVHHKACVKYSNKSEPTRNCLIKPLVLLPVVLLSGGFCIRFLRSRGFLLFEHWPRLPGLCTRHYFTIMDGDRFLMYFGEYPSLEKFRNNAFLDTNWHQNHNFGDRWSQRMSVCQCQMSRVISAFVLTNFVRRFGSHVYNIGIPQTH